MNLWVVFFTGLTSGGVTCAAMQGGLLASTIANQKQSEKDIKSQDNSPKSFDMGDWGPVTAFLATKLVAHIILGLLLGALGTVVQLGVSARLFFQGLAAAFMLATAMNLLEVHPIFRYITLTPPRFARKLIKNTTTANRLFAPALLGFLTILIPCGVTQAMEVVAIGSGNAIQGSLIMGAFVAGTIPAFAVIGIATAKLSETLRIYFLRAAAILLIIMSLYSINGILVTSGSSFSAQRIWSVLTTPVGGGGKQVEVVDGVQPVTIEIGNDGYSPTRFTVKAGTPVKLTLKAGDVYSCAASFTFRAFNIRTYVKPNTEEVVTFTPTNKGSYTYSCSMGMYSGIMEVI